MSCELQFAFSRKVFVLFSIFSARLGQSETHLWQSTHFELSLIITPPSASKE